MREIIISKSKLEYLYNKYKTSDVIKKLGVCRSTFYKMLDAAEIKRKKPDFKRGQNIKFKIIN